MDDHLLTPGEAAFVAGVPLREVYKVARQRLPADLLIREDGGLRFTETAAVCFRIDHDLPTDVPLEVRRTLYAALERKPRSRKLEYRSGFLSYVLDAAAATKAVAAELAAYRGALALISQNADVQAGAATFNGTRILVHTIADLLAAGVSRTELKEDYPHLTDEMLAVAPIYQRSHPRRGRPRAPRWRAAAEAATRRQPTV